MRVFLRKNLKFDKVELFKNQEGWVWCCLIHNDSFLVNFKDVMVEVSRVDLDFPNGK